MNSHGTPDMMVELDGTLGDLLPACVVSTTPPTVPASGLTLSAFATRAYVRAGTYLTYVDQPAVTVTLVGGDGTYWLAVTDDTFSAFAGWTRRAGSHYLWRVSATRPSDVDNLLTFAQLTVSGGNISAVTTPWGVAPPLALATADKVSLGGHASTGVLDVQGSVVASDAANGYYGVRVWPVAPAGALLSEGIRIEAATGAGLAGAGYDGIAIFNPPTGGSTKALHLQVAAGTSRHNIYAAGTAPNYFAGNVGIANGAPSYALDVTGDVRVMGRIGVGLVPGVEQLKVTYNRAAQSGIAVHTNADSGPGAAIYFSNTNPGTIVGTITTTVSATAYNTSSDGRLKEAVAALPDALATIQRLAPVQFRWKATGDSGQGFIAQDVQRVVPQAVSGDPDDPRPTMQLDFSKLVPHLVGAVQELAARLAAVEARA